MFNQYFQKLFRRARSTVVPLAILMMGMTNGAFPGLAQQSAKQTFSSATEASEAIFRAVKNNNDEAIANILGGASELASSYDHDQDHAEREMFVQKYQEMHRLSRDAEGYLTLYVGAENWPFPIPLVDTNGAWRFDPEAGAKEVMFRRIGDNELSAIVTCHEFIAAERRYRTQPTTTDDDPLDISPASLVSKAASGAGGGEPVLLHGYYFRVLPTSGTHGQRTRRFALIAYPAEYRSSGVMTFIISGKDIVYEKDLGTNTSTLASAMATFHKDATWHVARQ